MTPIESDVHDHLLWMQIHNYATTTIAGRARYLSYFLRFAQAHDVVEANAVTLELLVAYQQHLFAHRKTNGRPLAIGTQAQRLIPITQFFSWLRRERRILLNPASDLLMPRPDRRLPESTLSVAEMSVLMATPVLSKPLGLRDRAILEVFYSCALRRSELISLYLRDIDFDRGTAFVRCGKGSKDRYVPVGERALFWVRLYVEIVRPGYLTVGHPDHLFVASSGNPLRPDWLCRRVRQYLHLAGIEKRGSCHLLRHSVATLLLEGGADIRYVAEMLGHARLETTQRYTHVSIDRLRAVHASCHPASGVSVALASELCSSLPSARAGIRTHNKALRSSK